MKKLQVLRLVHLFLNKDRALLILQAWRLERAQLNRELWAYSLEIPGTHAPSGGYHENARF